MEGSFGKEKSLVDVSDIFIFSVRGRGLGSPRLREGRGSGFLFKIPRGGSPRRGGRDEGPGGCLWEFGWGGGKYRSSKWHYRLRNNSFELIMHFIADTDTDENYFEINFS